MSGKYRLDARLGGGGMAEVFIGASVGAEGFARRVAIKRVLPGFSDNPQFASMFVDEARISSRLGHPNIVSVLDFDRDPEGRLFLVMELVEGKDLDGLVATGLLPVPVVIFVISEVLRGLGYAHDLPVSQDIRGIVHRDVSPHNVLLSWEGAVKVSDFGIAKARSASDATASVFIKGKPAYMSPEQANGQPLDNRSDLFAVGIMLWEMLVGRRLFTGEDTRATLAAVLFGQIPRPRSLRPEVPKDIDRVCMKLLERDLPVRYATAELAMNDLLECQDAPKNGVAALIAILAQRFPQQMPMRQSALRSRGAQSAPPSPLPAPMDSNVAHAMTMPSGDADLRSAPTRAIQPRRGLRVLLLVALTLAVAGGSFAVVAAIFHKSNPGAAKVADAARPDAAIDAHVDARLDAHVDAAVDAPQDAAIDAMPDAHVVPPDAAVTPTGIGYLSVEQDPPVTVYLDGAKLGETPITRRSVPAGKHRLERKNSDNGYDKPSTINIVKGQTLDLDYINNLKP